jgi:hypothetical protein
MVLAWEDFCYVGFGTHGFTTTSSTTKSLIRFRSTKVEGTYLSSGDLTVFVIFRGTSQHIRGGDKSRN